MFAQMPSASGGARLNSTAGWIAVRRGSSLSEEAKDHFASVVAGEGEPERPQVLAELERGDLKPFYLQSPRGTYDWADAPRSSAGLIDLILNPTRAGTG